MDYLLYNCWFSLCGTCCCQHDWLDDLLMYETRLLSLCILLSSEIVQMRHFCVWKMLLLLLGVQDITEPETCERYVGFHVWVFLSYELQKSDNSCSVHAQVYNDTVSCVLHSHGDAI